MINVIGGGKVKILGAFFTPKLLSRARPWIIYEKLFFFQDGYFKSITLVQKNLLIVISRIVL